MAKFRIKDYVLFERRELRVVLIYALFSLILAVGSIFLILITMLFSLPIEDYEIRRAYQSRVIPLVVPTLVALYPSIKAAKICLLTRRKSWRMAYVDYRKLPYLLIWLLIIPVASAILRVDLSAIMGLIPQIMMLIPCVFWIMRTRNEDSKLLKKGINVHHKLVVGLTALAGISAAKIIYDVITLPEVSGVALDPELAHAYVFLFFTIIFLVVEVIFAYYFSTRVSRHIEQTIATQ